ncbi:MAG: SDR family oxidoreductase [Pseudomonadota bacterium]
MTKTQAHRWALVTGASGGIGQEIARELAAAGYALVLVARDAARLARVADELAQAHGVPVQPLPCDLAQAGAVEALAQALAQGDIVPEVLVNNAGFGVYGEHARTDWQAEHGMIELNVTALTALTKRLLPGMVRRGRGRILNVASTAAFQPGPYMAVYYATKAYVLSYSEALAEELSSSGITVTALCPGPTATAFSQRAQAVDSALFKGKRLPDASEVARYGVRALQRGRRVAVHGCMNSLLAQSVRFTPRRVVTRLVAQMSRRV